MDGIKFITDAGYLIWVVGAGVVGTIWKGAMMLKGLSSDVEQLKKDQSAHIKLTSARLEDVSKMHDRRLKEHKEQTDRILLTFQHQLSKLDDVPERIATVEANTKNLMKQGDRIEKKLDTLKEKNQ